MRLLALAVLLAAAAPRAAALAPVAVPWCAWAEVRAAAHVVRVLACTETRDACELGVDRARSPLGAIAGIRLVGDCAAAPAPR